MPQAIVDFFASYGWLLLTVGKALFVVMFAMNVAVILTWVDRRQGAMIQDRVGPDRAVIWLPRWFARGAVTLPAFGVAALVVGLALLDKGERGEGAISFGRAIVISQLALFMLWVTGASLVASAKKRPTASAVDALLASLGEPRAIVVIGMSAQIVLFLAMVLAGEYGIGAVLRDVAYGGGVLLLTAAILAGALYTATAMRDERVGLRLIGLLHPAADGLKTAFKEDIVPPGVDKLMHGLAPLISFFPALVVLAVVPFSDTLCFGGSQSGAHLDITGGILSTVPAGEVCEKGAFSLQVADFDVGILYFFAVAGTGIVGAALAGWASDNKYSLLGGLRAASQMVSYEVTLGLTLIGAMMIYGTLQVDDMVRWQAENTWGVFVQPLAFVLFFAAAVAESKRIPFDIPEGESELVAGYFTEYAGMKFAMFFFAEYIAVVSASAVMAAIFFGGWDLPFVQRDGIRVAFGDTVLFTQQLSHGIVVLLGFLGFVLKVLVLCWLQLTIRWTLPRFRYDQLMRLGWRMLLPLSLANVLLTGALILVVQGGGPGMASALGVASDLTKAAIAAFGVAAWVVFLLFVLKPAEHRRVLASTSARFAASLGGTPTFKMSS
jgi:NADH-quinone oxidoreductase subunit H